MTASTNDRIGSEHQKLLQNKASSSDPTRREKVHLCESVSFIAVIVLGFGFFLRSNGSSFFNETFFLTKNSPVAVAIESDGITKCKRFPCFEPSPTHVPLSRNTGLVSFLEFANSGPLVISYDERAMKINGERVFVRTREIY